MVLNETISMMYYVVLHCILICKHRSLISIMKPLSTPGKCIWFDGWLDGYYQHNIITMFYHFDHPVSRFHQRVFLASKRVRATTEQCSLSPSPNHLSQPHNVTRARKTIRTYKHVAVAASHQVVCDFLCRDSDVDARSHVFVRKTLTRKCGRPRPGKVSRAVHIHAQFGSRIQPFRSVLCCTSVHLQRVNHAAVDVEVEKIITAVD